MVSSKGKSLIAFMEAVATVTLFCAFAFFMVFVV